MLLKISLNLQGDICVGVSFSIKLQAESLQLHQLQFSREFCRIFRKTYIANASKALLEKFQSHWSSISFVNPENYCIPCRRRLLDQSTKQLLSNFESENHEHVSNFESWGLTLVVCKKNCSLENVLEVCYGVPSAGFKSVKESFF